ncbi:MaoC/PaaZ C-terminal domain-containing protein [Salinarimonas sp. NSM]|uniref:MaoC/PaaZ C-terminal domain-containing protein n=1 Tax=Salinarimonas sp. NSM TaxID=3458003 RepID=UPI004035CFE6
MPTSPPVHLEDFHPGDTMAYAPVVLDEAAIVAFARAWDPQPFHLDAAAARETFAGRLIASGWHGCALLMRLIADAFLLEAASLGAPGIESVAWRAPILPGMRLFGGHEVLETRASRTKPEMGLVRFRFHLADEGGAPLVEQTNWILFGRRGAAAPTPMARAAAPEVEPSPVDPAVPLPAFEDLVPGTREVVGARFFPAEEIVAFARAFDPQAFHVDAGAAAASRFGGLCASGWHTTAAFMRALVDHRLRQEQAVRGAGAVPVALGASPGFRDLSWTRPVYAGDTITFTTTIVEARASASRPGWGIVRQRNEGTNQRGEPVLSFEGSVFWQGRG